MGAAMRVIVTVGVGVPVAVQERLELAVLPPWYAILAGEATGVVRFRVGAATLTVTSLELLPMAFDAVMRYV